MRSVAGGRGDSSLSRGTNRRRSRAREAAGARVEDRELGGALEECLETLSEDQREVFDLRHGEGFKYAEIAAALEISHGTVMSRLHRAREKMRECLEGKGMRP